MPGLKSPAAPEALHNMAGVNPNPRASASERQTLPVTALIAVAIAGWSVWFSLGATPILPILAIALVASYFAPWRISSRWIAWVVGALGCGLILVACWGNIGDNTLMTVNGPTLQLAALIALGVLVLQCWVRHNDRGSRGFILFLSGLAFLIGCTNWDDTLIRFVAPAYMFFAILSFPRFRSVTSTGSQRPSALALRTVAVLVALGAGAAIYTGFWSYREQLTEWGDHLLQNKRLPENAGVSANPVLGDSFGQQGSPIRVLRIMGPLSEDHLRGLSFDTYRMGAWQGGIYGVPVDSFESANPQALDAQATGPRATVTAFADSTGLIYAPLNSSGIATNNAGEHVSWSPGFGAAVRTTATPPYQYTLVEGRSEAWQGPLCTPPSAHYRERLLALPYGMDPEVRQLALRIGKGLTTPQAKIAAVTDYLLTHYTYSLTIHPGPGDPVANFLLHKHAAYCEYFASAAAILLRYLGVPTRYVVGYYAHESDGPSVTVVRQWDSHAWAEAWVDGVGWVTVDATPGNGRPDQLDHRVPWWTRISEWIQDHVATWRAMVTHLTPAQIAEIAGAALLLSVAIRWLWLRGWRAWKRRRVRETRFRYTPVADQDLQAMAARFEAFLARSGLACPSEATWRECIRTAEHADLTVPIDSDVALAFIAEYNGARFGDRDDPDRNARLQEALSRLEESPHPHPLSRRGERGD